MPSYENLLAELENLEAELSDTGEDDAAALETELDALLAFLEDDRDDLEAELLATLEQAVDLVGRLRGSPPEADKNPLARFEALEKRAAKLLTRIRAHLKET